MKQSSQIQIELRFCDKKKRFYAFQLKQFKKILWLVRSEACKAREQFSGQFADVDNKTDNVSLKAHYSSVDTVLLINDGSLLLSGSRDRSMVS